MNKLFSYLTSITLLCLIVTSVYGQDVIPKGWFEAGSNPNQYEITIDNQVTYNGKSSIQIKSLDPNTAQDFGNLMQTIQAENYRGKRVKFSGYIKTENVQPVGASLWMRVDRERMNENDKNVSIAFDNMMNRSPIGTTDWQKFEIVLDIYNNAEYISFGMMLIREGTAWFAGLKFEEVDKSVPVTDLKMQENIRTFPTNPVNLEFE